MMDTRRIVGFASVVMALLACGCAFPKPSHGDSLKGQGGHAGAVQESLLIVDSLVKFDPVIDVTKSVEDNTKSIAQQIKNNVQACENVTVTAAASTIAIVFVAGEKCSLGTDGAPVTPGVALGTSQGVIGSIIASGTINVSVTAVPSGIAAAIDFVNLVTSGQTLNAKLLLLTKDSIEYTLTGNLSAADNISMALNLTIHSESEAFSLTGEADVDDVKITYDALRKNAADCYPSSGELTLRDGEVYVTFTFTGDSAATGTVVGSAVASIRTAAGDFVVGREETRIALAPYADCPRATPATGDGGT